MEVRMKRLWKWLKGLVPYHDKYTFYRKDQRKDRSGNISFKFYQNIYRRRRFFRVAVWHGTVAVRVALDGVKFRGKSDDAKPYVLHGSQTYTLRCDKDYVELLKHLAVVEQRGMLNTEERLLIARVSELLMALWPPRANISVHTEEIDVDD
jgi:hypothetical protein